MKSNPRFLSRSGLAALAIASSVGAFAASAAVGGVDASARPAAVADYQVGSDGIIDVRSVVYGTYAISAEQWNTAQLALRSDQDQSFEKLDQAVEAAFDMLYADVASTEEAGKSHKMWQECMGGQWESSVEFFSHLEKLAFDGEGTLSKEDEAYFASEIERALDCQRQSSDGFNAALARMLPDWLAEQDELLSRHAEAVQKAAS